MNKVSIYRKFGAKFWAFLKESTSNEINDQVKDFILTDEVKTYIKNNGSKLLSCGGSFIAGSGALATGGIATSVILLGIAGYCGYKKYKSTHNTINKKSQEAFDSLLNEIKGSGLSLVEISEGLHTSMKGGDFTKIELFEILQAIKDNPKNFINKLSISEEFIAGINEVKAQNKKILKKLNEVYDKSGNIFEFFTETNAKLDKIIDSTQEINKNVANLLSKQKINILISGVSKKIKEYKKVFSENFDIKTKLNDVIIIVAEDNNIPDDKIKEFRKDFYYILQQITNNPNASYNERYNALMLQGEYENAEQLAVSSYDDNLVKCLDKMINAADAALMELKYSVAAEHLKKAYNVMLAVTDIESTIKFRITYNLAITNYHLQKFDISQNNFNKAEELWSDLPKKKASEIERNLITAYLINIYNALGDYKQARFKAKNSGIINKIKKVIESSSNDIMKSSYAYMLYEIANSACKSNKADQGIKLFNWLLQKIDNIINNENKVDNIKWLLLKHKVLYFKGRHLFKDLKTNEANKLFFDSLTLTENFISNKQNNPNILQAKSLSLMRIADVWFLRENRFEDALEYYKKSLIIQKEIDKEFGSTAERKRDIAINLIKIADIWYKNKKLIDNALKYYKKSLDIRREIENKFGSTAERKEDIAFSLERIGIVWFEERELLDDALNYYKKSLAIRQDIVSQFGSTAEREYYITVSLNKIADIWYYKGDSINDALGYYNESLQKMRSVICQFGSSDVRQRSIAISLKKIADVYHYDKKEYIPALKLYKEAEKIMAKRIDKHKKITSFTCVARSIKKQIKLVNNKIS